MSPAPYDIVTGEESELARHIRLQSVRAWGEPHAVTLIGRHPSIVAAQEKALRYAQADGPVLIIGETGTGKELFARSIYLLGARRGKPFLTVNCARYTDGQLIASELFGHKRGSFTGAVADHRGVFEAADGGVVFLDEVGELTPTAQAMLLRVLGEGEVVPVGDTRVRRVNVRVVVATNRDLTTMVAEGTFRADLYYRLRFLQVTIPPLRHRGDDWRLLVDHHIRRLNDRTGGGKRISATALARLAMYDWPGNIRELKALVESSYHLTREGGDIEPDVFEELLLGFEAALDPVRDEPRDRSQDMAQTTLAEIEKGAGTFWSIVYEPYMNRELNRHQVRHIVTEGLRRSNWSYKRALDVFGVAPEDYLKFMDFLRHHRLKPER